MSESTELVAAKEETSLTSWSLKPSSFSEAITICEYLAKSLIIPKNFQGKPHDIFVAMNKGASLGLDVFQSMEGIPIINGRAFMEVDTMKAIVLASGLCTKLERKPLTTPDGKFDGYECTVGRKGVGEHTERMTMAMAQKAEFLTRTDVWKKFPQRMMAHRAMGYALRELFSDLFKGMRPNFPEDIELIQDTAAIPAENTPQGGVDRILADFNMEEIILDDATPSSANSSSASSASSAEAEETDAA